ncbi:hypothetical protein [Ancylobacter sp. TS-1]|uniref:hypothetical protein n=1 Tax=Ancylobacter sp. TS-1 TaxID=1850374 RepID=UPI001265BEC3|nr:hypothetical protein [Ancylobacter sp. TS-1]QFR32408.1 hypothetical protein GBB76_04350 [Ancylobacter sp. TS-1]
MTARVGQITHRMVKHLRQQAKDTNAIASALYEDGYFAASHEATQAALYLASAAQALEAKLGSAG